MRTIDADKLVDMLYDNEFAVLCPLDEVSGVVDACPTVDAVPVVRCKDCKHAYIIAFSDNGFGTVLCGLLSSCENVAQVVRQFDDFCSYGEKKEG